MHKFFKAASAALTAVIFAAVISGCASAPANTVFSVDDLPGKKIGVQLGTTGDTYASDYEKPEDEAQPKSVVERYKKGSEAVLALKQGKIDCVIIDSEPAKEYVSQNSDLKILDDPFALEDYAIQTISQGRDAQGEAILKISRGEETVSGRGLSTDIIEASILAYINALNKLRQQR